MRLEVETKDKYQQVQDVLYNPRTYRLFRSGTHIFIDPRNCQVISVVKFTEFASMDSATRNQLNHVSQSLIRHYQNNTGNSSNGPMIGGYMGTYGWRKSSCRDQIFGMYAPKGNFKSSSAQHSYQEEGNDFRCIEEFLWHRFQGMAKVAAEKARNDVQDYGVPSFGQSEVHENTYFHFASNLTYTLHNFHNHLHCDHDANQWTYGMWIPIRLPDGRVVCFADGYNVQGGQFLFHGFGFGVDVNRCDGICEVVWQSTMYHHQTVQSHEPSPNLFTRLAFSCQFPTSLANASELYREGHYEDNANAYFAGRSHYAAAKQRF